jgi:HEAT repeat protein
MLGDFDWLVRVSAIESLMSFNNRALFDDFQHLLERKDEEMIVQRYAAESLSELALPQNLSIIERDIEATKIDPTISIWLVKAAYRLKGQNSLGKILEIMTLLADEDEVSFVFNVVDELTVGKPPIILLADIPPLIQAIDIVDKRVSGISKKAEALKERLGKVQAGKNISPDEVRCC